MEQGNEKLRQHQMYNLIKTVHTKAEHDILVLPESQLSFDLETGELRIHGGGKPGGIAFVVMTARA